MNVKPKYIICRGDQIEAAQQIVNKFHGDVENRNSDQSILLSVERQMREEERRQELNEWMWCAGICAVILVVTSVVCWLM